MRLQPFPPAKSSGSQDRAPSRVAPEDALWLLSLSVVIPVALLVVASRATGAPVFHPRYMMCVEPAVALLAAWLLRTIQPNGVRRAVAACYLLIMLMTLGNVTHLGITHTKEDWRAAMQTVRALTRQRPVLMSGIYIESDNLAWVQDARHLSYMRAPLDVYPTGGSAVRPPRPRKRSLRGQAARLHARARGPFHIDRPFGPLLLGRMARWTTQPQRICHATGRRASRRLLPLTSLDVRAGGRTPLKRDCHRLLSPVTYRARTTRARCRAI
jgi:hypothetical protein